jgi:hypothetical protein
MVVSHHFTIFLTVNFSFILLCFCVYQMIQETTSKVHEEPYLSCLFSYIYIAIVVSLISFVLFL